MKRKNRNPRRVAVDILRVIKSNVTTMVTTWDQSQATYDNTIERPDAPGYFGVHRPLRDDEKHENSIEQWRRLADFMTTVEAQAAVVRSFAIEQAHRLERQQDGPS